MNKQVFDISSLPQCVNSVPPYVRKLHFMYELIRTSSKYHWSIYRTSGKCRWSIYRTSRKRRGTFRIVHKSGTEFTHCDYGDVIMGAIASQITSLTIVYSTVYSDADQRKHQSSASLAFVWGIHRGPVNSPHKWPVTRKMFPLDDVIMLQEWHGPDGCSMRPCIQSWRSFVWRSGLSRPQWWAYQGCSWNKWCGPNTDNDLLLTQRAPQSFPWLAVGRNVNIQCGAVTTINFLTNIHKWYPIARPLGRAMGCLLWIQHLIDIGPQAPVIKYAMSDNIRSRYNGTRLYIHFEIPVTKSLYISPPWPSDHHLCKLLTS